MNVDKLLSSASLLLSVNSVIVHLSGNFWHTKISHSHSHVMIPIPSPILIRSSKSTPISWDSHWSHAHLKSRWTFASYLSNERVLWSYDASGFQLDSTTVLLFSRPRSESWAHHGLEHSNSRFESIRFDSLCESISIDSFCKKSAFRFTSCHAVYALNK